MPLARLRLRLPTREGEKAKLGKRLKTLAPQFPLAEPAGSLSIYGLLFIDGSLTTPGFLLNPGSLSGYGFLPDLGSLITTGLLI